MKRILLTIALTVTFVVGSVAVTTMTSEPVQAGCAGTCR